MNKSGSESGGSDYYETGDGTWDAMSEQALGRAVIEASERAAREAEVKRQAELKLASRIADSADEAAIRKALETGDYDEVFKILSGIDSIPTTGDQMAIEQARMKQAEAHAKYDAFLPGAMDILRADMDGTSTASETTSTEPEATTIEVVEEEPDDTEETEQAEPGLNDDPEVDVDAIDDDDGSLEFIMAVGDVSYDATVAARDAAEQLVRKMESTKASKIPIVGGFVRAYNAFRHRGRVATATKDMLSAVRRQEIGLVYGLQGNEIRDFNRGVVNDIADRYAEGLNAHTQVGESDIEDKSEADYAVTMRDGIRDLLETRDADGNMLSIEEFRNRLDSLRTDVLESICSEHRENNSARKGILLLNNFSTVAEQMYTAVDHGRSIDRVVGGFKLVSQAEVRSGAVTEQKQGKVDQMVERMAKKRGVEVAAALTEPEVLGLGANLAINAAVALGAFGAANRAGSTAANLLIPGFGLVGGAGVAGVMAGLRAKRSYLENHNQEWRMRELGLETGPVKRELTEQQRRELSPQRQAQLEARYERQYNKARDQYERDYIETTVDMVPASAIIDQLNSGVDRLSSGEATNGDVSMLFNQLIGFQMRSDLGDELHKGLISYSDPTKRVQERTQVDLALRDAKGAVAEKVGPEELNKGALAAFKALGGEGEFDAGISDEAKMDMIIRARANVVNSLRGEISSKERLVSKVATKKAWAAGAKMAGASLVIGVAMQEIVAELDPNMNSLRESLTGQGNGTRDTLLAGAFGNRSNMHNLLPNAEATENYNVTQDADGNFDLVGPDGKVIVDNIEINPVSGEISAEALAELKASGFTVTTVAGESFKVQVGSETQTVGMEQAFDNSEYATKARIAEFGDYRTSGSYERVELSGEIAKGPNGGIIFSHNGSANDISVGPSHTFDYSGANTDSNFAVFIKPGDGADILRVPIGEEITDPNILQMFQGNDMHAGFSGKWLSWGRDMGQDSGGVTQIFSGASIRGTDAGFISTEIPIFETINPISYSIEAPIPQVSEIVPPVIVPLGGRRALDQARRRSLPSTRPTPRGYESYNNSYRTPERRAPIVEQASPRLRENPDANLHLGQELDWYQDNLRTRKNEAYVSEVESAAASIESQLPKVESIVTIPVNAAAESDNIYRTLSLYAQQEGVDPTSNLVLLHVNYFDRYADRDGNDTTAETLAAVEKTKQEIARAQADYPQLKVATFDTEFKRDEVNERGGIIGPIYEKLGDVALVALDRAVKSGAISPDADVSIIRNDADEQGLSRDYIQKMQRSMHENTETDVFKGMTRFGVAQHERAPGLGLVTNIMQAYDRIADSRTAGRVHTGGANFAVRASMAAGMGGFGSPEGDTGAGSDDLNVGWKVAALRYGSKSRSGGNYTGSREEAPGENSNIPRPVFKRVASATVDTDSDREEYAYLHRPKGVMDTWFAFDGRHRSEGVNRGYRENIDRDWKTISERVRRNIQGIMNDYSDIGTSGLPFFFPRGAYTTRRKGDGSWEFRFTPSGSAWLKQQMQEDQDGANYGARSVRRLYEQRSTGSGDKPSRLVR